MQNKIFQLATAVGDALQQRQLSVSTAESCTGGLIAGAITAVAGSSNWFEQGFVTYANRAKQRLLGVTAADLEQYGAVSETVVKAMAEGARQYGADWAIATSGVAGPDGGTAEKPVGTVWFAWATDTVTLCEKRVFPGDRQAIREQAVAHALQGLLNQLNK